MHFQADPYTKDPDLPVKYDGSETLFYCTVFIICLHYSEIILSDSLLIISRFEILNSGGNPRMLLYIVSNHRNHREIGLMDK